MQQQPGLIIHRCEALGGRLQHPVAERLQVAGDHGQGGAQVVGDIGGHLAAELDGAGQIGAHVVELPGEHPQLVARAHRHALVQVAAGDALGSGGQLAHRPGDHPCQQQAERERDSHHHYGGHAERQIDMRQVPLLGHIPNSGEIRGDEGPNGAPIDNNGRAARELARIDRVARGIGAEGEHRQTGAVGQPKARPQRPAAYVTGSRPRTRRPADQTIA